MPRTPRSLTISDIHVNLQDPLSIMNEGGILAQRLKVSGIIPMTMVESVAIAAEAMDMHRFTEAMSVVENFANQFDISLV